MSVGKKGKRKQYHLPYNIKAVGKNFKWGRGEGNGNFGKKMEMWKNIKLLGTLYTPGQDEAVFSVETALDQTYEWSDKYRPRKPRFVFFGLVVLWSVSLLN